MKRLFAIAFLALATPTVGQEAPLTALETATQSRGWEAVGRLNIGKSGFCSGSLIAPDLVLTAAHCLYHHDTGEPYQAKDYEFMAGWRNGSAIAYRGIKRMMGHPKFVYNGPNNMDSVPYDLALFQLDRPIQIASIAPFATGPDPRPGDAVDVVSYAFDRADAPSLQDGCHVIGPNGSTMIYSCSVDFGSSGAPIFKVIDGVPQIVSVISAKAEMDGQPVSLAPMMGEPLAELKAAFQGAAPSLPGFVQVQGALPQVGAAPKSGGAKFISP